MYTTGRSVSGTPVEITETVRVGNRRLALTTKSLYFAVRKSPDTVQEDSYGYSLSGRDRRTAMPLLPGRSTSDERWLVYG